MVFGVQWWQVVLAVIVYFGLGAAWYSPALFGPRWARELGHRAGQTADPTRSLIVTFLAMVLLALVAAYLVRATGTAGLERGMLLGAKLWLGFVATTALINNVFQNGSRTLFAIDQGYHLVGLILATAVLAL